MKLFREKLVEYGTYFVVFLLPVLYFGSNRYLSYTTSKTFFFYGCMEVIFAFWLYSLFVDKRYRFSKKALGMFLPFLLYILFLTLSGLLGLRPEASFWSSLSRGTGLLTLYHIFAMSLVVASLVKVNIFSSYTKKLLIWFISGAFILSISIWLGNEGLNLPAEFLQKSKGGGLIGNSSLSATYLIFASFFSIFLITHKDSSKKLRIFLWVFIVFVIFSPLFINIYGWLSGDGLVVSARGAMIGILLGAIASSFAYLYLSSKKMMRILGIIGLVVSVGVFCVLWINVLKPETQIHKKVTESISESRFVFWDIADKAIKEKPILGWGSENYSLVFQKYFDPSLYLQSDTTVETWNDRAHNIVFDIGVSGGWTAIVLYFIFLSSLVYGIYKAFIGDKITRLQSAVLFGLLVAYFFQNLFVFDSLISLMALSVFTGIIFGLASSNNNEIEKFVLVNNKFKNISAFLIVLVFVPIWIFCAWMPVRKSIVFAKVISMPLNTRSDHYSDLLKGSHIGNSFEIGVLADDAYKLYSKNQNQILENPELLKYSKIDIDKFLEFLETVSKDQFYDYRLHLSMIRLYNLKILFSGNQVASGQFQHIISIGEHTRTLSPNDPQVDWAIAQTYLYNKDYSGAQKSLERAVMIAPNIPWTHRFLIKFAKDTNNQELYESALKNANSKIINFTPGGVD